MLTVIMIFSLLGLQQESQPVELAPAKLQALLEQLGDPQFERRQQAVEQLYAAGPAALQALEQLPVSGDYEAALRARRLLERIQKLYLVGATVELAVRPATAAWDQPITLVVTFRNPTSHPVLLPFFTTDRQVLDQNPLAVQVGNMLDALDFVQVSGPDGQPRELIVDEYGGTAAIEQAIEARAYTAPTSTLPPGSEFTLELQEFNRGFARVRMLQAGRYTLQFLYVPEWDDPQMVERLVGLIRSAAVTVEITSSAPAGLGQGSDMIACELRRKAEQWEVVLVNRYDRPCGVNLNLGGSGLTKHARLSWEVESSAGQQRVTQPFPDAGAVQWDQFQLLAPLEEKVIFRTTLADLAQIPGLELLSQPPAGTTLRAVYSNHLNRSQFHRLLNPEDNMEEVERIIQKIPLVTFVGLAESVPLTVNPPLP
ncbi:MAG: hypothetical protein HJJLKODD_02096 [Phycisphaerae bacterium]|nr:hypothetical protein [Phycisphaerae bacterium]